MKDTDKLGETSLEIDYRRVALVILLVLLIVIGTYLFFISGDSESEPDGQYTLDFTDDEIIVAQMDGEIMEEDYELTINYNDDETETWDVSLTDHEEEVTIEPEGYMSEVDGAELTYGDGDGQLHILSESPPSEIVSEEPEVSAEDVTVEHGDPVQIDGSSLVDADGSIDTYSWSMGDETEDIDGIALNHIYEEPGEYQATLTVIDEYGNEAEDTFNIEVEDVSEVDSVVMIDGTVGEEMTLSAEESIVNGTDIDEYEWEFEDDTTETGETVTHTVDEVGEYEITLTTTAENSNTDSTTIVIQAEASVTADVSADTEEDPEIEFDASESDAEPASIESYYWDFDDGTTLETTDSSVTHEYTENEDFTAEVTVEDEYGEVDTASVDVTVDNATESDSDDDGLEDTVAIELDNDSSDAYTVTTVSDGYEDDVLQDDETGDENPTLYLEEDYRYVFMDIPDDDHPIEFYSDSGGTLLSQDADGTMEDNDDVDWEEEFDGEVALTVTDDLADELEGYICAQHSEMDGNIVID